MNSVFVSPNPAYPFANMPRMQHLTRRSEYAGRVWALTAIKEHKATLQEIENICLSDDQFDLDAVSQAYQVLAPERYVAFQRLKDADLARKLKAKREENRAKDYAVFNATPEELGLKPIPTSYKMPKHTSE